MLELCVLGHTCGEIQERIRHGQHYDVIIHRQRGKHFDLCFHAAWKTYSHKGYSQHKR